MLPKFYLFDKSLPGELYVVFDEHPMHAENLCEHLEGFARTPEDEFTLHGLVDGDTVLYANGDPQRMRDGVVLLFNVSNNQTQDVGDWAREESKWPRSHAELGDCKIRVPGRWLTPEESAVKWLAWQGIPVRDTAHLHSAEIRHEMERRGVDYVERFAHPGLAMAKG